MSPAPSTSVPVAPAPSPADHAAFWDDLDAELAAVPVAADVRPDPYRSTAEYRFSTVRLGSIGLDGSLGYRIAGFLSVPTAPGPHPAMLELPRHGSVNHTPHHNERSRFIVFTLMHRGQRLADSPFRASYPGLLTRGIESTSTWIYRGIVADCLRATEFLVGVDGVDRERVGAVGDDLAVLTASRRPVFRALRVDLPLLTGLLERSAGTVSYPDEEINDLRRREGADLGAVAETIAPFDPLVHAPAVTASTLVSCPASGRGVAERLLTALGAHGARFPSSSQDGLDADARDAWLARSLGVQRRSRFLDAAEMLPGDPGTA